MDSELESLSLFQLLRAFERIMSRLEQPVPRAVHQIAMFNYTIEEQQTRILLQIEQQQRAIFEGFFGACQDRVQAVIKFLALLELINLQKVRIIQGLGVNNFWLEGPASEVDSEEE